MPRDFGYDGTPKIDRDRILQGAGAEPTPSIESVIAPQEKVDETIAEVVRTLIFANDLQKELADKVSNIMPVPETAPAVRASVMRRSNIPKGQYIDFALFRQAVDTLLRARSLKTKDLVDFVGDPSIDDKTYQIKQRLNIGDELGVLELFLAGAVIPGVYIASRVLMTQLKLDIIPIFGTLLKEGIAYLLLLGLDAIAVKAMLRDNGISTLIDGIPAEQYVDYLEQNPQEIHKVLEDKNIPDANKLDDFRAIQQFALNTIRRSETSEYDSWMAYFQVGNSRSNLERVVQISPNYSERWRFVSDEDFDIQNFVSHGESVLRRVQAQSPNNAFTLKERLRRSILPMQDAQNDAINLMVSDIQAGYRNMITSLLYDYLPFPSEMELLPEEFVEAGLGISIDLNRSLLCCLVRIFSGFDPQTLRLFANILKLGAVRFQLHASNLLERYIQSIANDLLLSILSAIDTLKYEIINQILSVLNEDGEIMELIIACTPAKEILLKVIEQFNLLVDQLKRLIIKFAENIRITSDSMLSWGIDFPGKRTLLFLSELLNVLADEIELPGSRLCPGFGNYESERSRNRFNERVDPEVAPEFVRNFKTDLVPTIDFSAEFLRKYSAGKEIIRDGVRVPLDNVDEVSPEVMRSRTRQCQDELSSDRQIAIQERIRNAIKNIINGQETT